MITISEKDKKKCQEILASKDTPYNKFIKIFEIYKPVIAGTELYYAILGYMDSQKISDTCENDITVSDIKNILNEKGFTTSSSSDATPSSVCIGTCKDCGGDVYMNPFQQIKTYPAKLECSCSKCGKITYMEVE